jgi:hypothetical protein
VDISLFFSLYSPLVVTISKVFRVNTFFSLLVMAGKKRTEIIFFCWLPGFDQGGKFLSSSDFLVFSYDFQDVFPLIAVYFTDLDDGVLFFQILFFRFPFNGASIMQFQTIWRKVFGRKGHHRPNRSNKRLSTEKHPENHKKTRENQKKTATYHLDRNQATNKEKNFYSFLSRHH